MVIHGFRSSLYQIFVRSEKLYEIRQHYASTFSNSFNNLKVLYSWTKTKMIYRNHLLKTIFSLCDFSEDEDAYIFF